MEVWKNIKDFEGLYQVSNLGNIKRITTNKVLNPSISNRGWLYLSLSKDNKYKNHRVHRIVAQTFIPNPKDKATVNHINGIKTDNRVENLEWNTIGENVRHAIKNGLQIKTKKVRCVETGIIYNSINEASALSNITRSGINMCCKKYIYKGNLHKTSGGFHWEFVNV